MSCLNIMIIEDLVLTRMGIRTALNNSGLDCKIVAEASTIAEAKDILKNQPDIHLVLLDLMLPDGNGSEIVRHIKDNNISCKILIISADTNKQNILNLIDLGIDGFISKFTDTDTLEAAITSVSNGIEFFGKDISEIIHAVSMSKAPQNDIFTAREMEIMRLCAKGYPVKRIADELSISSRTVETHKNNIFKKLGFSSTGELMNYAFENGIIKN